MKFKSYEWIQFASLLEKGYPLDKILNLMGKESNEIILSIQNGHSLEEIILRNNKGKFYNYLAFFIHISTLYDAIFSAKKMYDLEKELKKTFRKKTAYPIFIFIFSFITIYLFSNFIIPQLLKNFGEENENVLFIFVMMIQGICVFIFSSLFIISIILLIINGNKISKRIFLEKYAYKCSFIKDYISFNLSAYLKTLHERGLSSKQSFYLLSTIKNDTYLFYCIQEINIGLNEGKDLSFLIQSNQYLSKRFIQNYLIGSNNNDLEKSLDLFYKDQKERWFICIDRISLLIQLISYSFVAILIVCVYQIMLIPLNLLNDL